MFKINRYTISHEKQWNEFVDLGNNGTIFHLRTFFKYHPEDRFRDHSLLVKKKGRLFSVFPAAEITIDNKVFLISFCLLFGKVEINLCNSSGSKSSGFIVTSWKV